MTMNKNILMVLAIIVALLAGWLLLSVAVVTKPDSENAGQPVSGTVSPPEVPVPSSTEIKVTVVDELDTPGTNLTAEVVAP